MLCDMDMTRRVIEAFSKSLADDEVFTFTIEDTAFLLFPNLEVRL